MRACFEIYTEEKKQKSCFAGSLAKFLLCHVLNHLLTSKCGAIICHYVFNVRKCLQESINNRHHKFEKLHNHKKEDILQQK